MKIIIKNKLSRKIGYALFLSVLMMPSANAATFNEQAGFESKKLNFDDDIFKNETQELDTKVIKKNYQLTLDLVRNNHYKQANQKIDSLIKKNPSIAIYYNLKALLQITNNDQIGAEKSFLKAVELNPKNTQALVRLSTLELDRKQFDKAKQYAKKALAVNSYEVVAYQVLADIAMNKQGITAAEIIFEEALGKVKNKPEAELAILRSLSKLYLMNKQPQKILALAETLYSRNPELAKVQLFLVEAQLVNRDEVGAEQNLRQIIAKWPNNATTLFLLAKVLSNQKGKETEALHLLDKAALNLKKPILVLTYKSEILRRQKQYQQALSVARQVDKLAPKQDLGKKLMAEVYLAEGKYTQALKQFQLAYKITPNINNLDGLLKILTLQHQYSAVITLLNQALIEHENSTPLYFRLAVAYQNANQNALSIKNYQKVLHKQANNVIALNNLAWMYSHEHNPKAIIIAKQAYDIAPKSSVIADTYGYMLLQQGKHQESIKVLERGASLEHVSPLLKLHLAEAYIANKQASKAKKLLTALSRKQSVATSSAKKLLKQYQ